MVSAQLRAQLANQPHRLGLLCVRVPPRGRMSRRCLCRHRGRANRRQPTHKEPAIPRQLDVEAHLFARVHSHILAFPSSGPSGKARAIQCGVWRIRRRLFGLGRGPGSHTLAEPTEAAGGSRANPANDLPDATTLQPHRPVPTFQSAVSSVRYRWHGGGVPSLPNCALEEMRGRVGIDVGRERH